MGEVINFPTPSTEIDIPKAGNRLSRDDVALLTTIGDNVETLFDKMAGIRRNPEEVALRLRALAWCVSPI